MASLLLATAFLSPVALSLEMQQTPPGVTFFEFTVLSQRVRGVKVDLSTGRFKTTVAIARSGIGSSEIFRSFVQRTNPVVAINGAYFDVGRKRPIGDIAVDGETLHSGRMGTAFGVKKDGTLTMQRVQRHRSVDWSGFQMVIACGPLLVSEGRKDVQFSEEGFQHPSVIGSTSRMGLGFDDSGTLYLVQVRSAVNFDQFADVMLRLGCTYAMNLDSGAAAALFVRGRGFVQSPGRELVSVFLVQDR